MNLWVYVPISNRGRGICQRSLRTHTNPLEEEELRTPEVCLNQHASAYVAIHMIAIDRGRYKNVETI